MKPKRIIFTGGGTLGHVMPNIPLIRYFQDEGWEVAYIGSKKGIEREKMNELNIKYFPIRSGKLRRYFDLQNFLDIFNVSIAIIQAFFIFIRWRPNVVFSKGGYVALPPVIGAWITRVPIVIHESDMTPGLTTKLSKRFATVICTAFKNTLRYLPANKTTYTGLPVRDLVFEASETIGRQFLGEQIDKPILLVFGGSLGAQFLNNLAREHVKNGNLSSFHVVNICGRGQLDPDMNTFSNYQQFESLSDEFLHVMKSAEFVITRGGATSLFELLAMKKPHPVVPLPKSVSRGDQIDNATYFRDLGVSDFIEEEHFEWDTLREKMEMIQQNWPSILTKLDEMAFSQSSEKVRSILMEKSS